MTYGNILDEVISGLQPENIPPDYIVMAKIVNSNGVEKILRGVDLENFMNDPNRGLGVAEARVILDVRKIRTSIIASVFDFFDHLNTAVGYLNHPSDDEYNDEDWTPED